MTELTSNADHFRLVRGIAESLGREIMGVDEYFKLIGATTPMAAQRHDWLQQDRGQPER